MEEFLLVKQMEELYTLCIEAKKARDEEAYGECMDKVRQAFAWMARSLCRSAQSDTEALKTLCARLPFLTQRSRATYLQYIEEKEQTPSAEEAENAYESLVEEIAKYAKYYCKEETPQTTQEIAEQYAHGRNSTKSGRNRADSLFRGTVLALFAIAGVGMVILSVFVPSLSHLLVGGVAVLLFGMLFYSLGSKVKK